MELITHTHSKVMDEFPDDIMANKIFPPHNPNTELAQVRKYITDELRNSNVFASAIPSAIRTPVSLGYSRLVNLGMNPENHAIIREELYARGFQIRYTVSTGSSLKYIGFNEINPQCIPTYMIIGGGSCPASDFLGAHQPTVQSGPDMYSLNKPNSWGGWV